MASGRYCRDIQRYFSVCFFLNPTLPSNCASIPIHSHSGPTRHPTMRPLETHQPERYPPSPIPSERSATSQIHRPTDRRVCRANRGRLSRSASEGRCSFFAVTLLSPLPKPSASYHNPFTTEGPERWRGDGGTTLPDALLRVPWPRASLPGPCLVPEPLLGNHGSCPVNYRLKGLCPAVVRIPILFAGVQSALTKNTRLRGNRGNFLCISI